MRKNNDIDNFQTASEPEKVVYGWFRFGTDHGYFIYDSVEELERETGMVGLSKELTYGLWIINEETDMAAMLLSTFEECPFVDKQHIYEKEKGYYSYGYEPAFIGKRRYLSQEPFEEYGDDELAMDILCGRYQLSTPNNTGDRKEFSESLQEKPSEKLRTETETLDDADVVEEKFCDHCSPDNPQNGRSPV